MSYGQASGSTDKKIYNYVVAETPKMHDSHPDSPANMGQAKTPIKDLQPLFTDKEVYDYAAELTPQLQAKYNGNHGGLVDGLAAINTSQHFSMTVMDEL
jgi:hypothetical protein